VLRPRGSHRDAARRLLCGWDDPLSDTQGIRIFDYPQFAMKLRDRVRDRAASLAAEAGVTIEHITTSHIRKESVVARVLGGRANHPGPVHVILGMEA
jgi:hypothetical protein